MRKILLILSVACCLTCAAKQAIMVSHYGSSEADTRTKTIQKITDEIGAANPGIEVRQSYISPVVRKRMVAAGIDAPSPTECLQRLAKEGYDTVYVQSSTILDGAEMQEVRNACAEMQSQFKLLKLGRPLCFSPEDCQEVVEIMASAPHALDEAVIWVGHGNNLPSTATYCQLDYMLHATGHPDVHVSTIEGYPTAQTLIEELKNNPNIRKVKLMPFLLVCGNHTREDIAVDFVGELQQAGYETEVVYQGFAEIPAIRAIYVQRVQELLEI